MAPNWSFLMRPKTSKGVRFWSCRKLSKLERRRSPRQLLSVVSSSLFALMLQRKIVGSGQRSPSLSSWRKSQERTSSWKWFSEGSKEKGWQLWQLWHLHHRGFGGSQRKPCKILQRSVLFHRPLKVALLSEAKFLLLTNEFNHFVALKDAFWRTLGITCTKQSGAKWWSDVWNGHLWRTHTKGLDAF